MPYVVAAIVILALLCLANLALTAGIVRRLREHTVQLANTAAAAPDFMLLAGQPFGDFTARTVTGEPIDETVIEPDTLVGFFSPSCGTCAAEMPRFAKLARQHPGGMSRVLSVVVGQTAESARPAAMLGDVGRVVVAAHGDNPVETAFAVRGFPAYCLTGQGGTVAVSGTLDLISHVHSRA